MKPIRTVVTLLVLLGAAFGAPKPTKLEFRSLYKEPIAPLKNISPHIIDGDAATPHSIPYQAFLTIYTATGGTYCGGSLISSTLVLTAAHCVYGAVEVSVVLGAINPLQIEDNQVRLTSTQVVLHENYISGKIYNDIALVKLPFEVETNEYIQIIPLPSPRCDLQKTYIGKVGKASGWGVTDPDGKVSQELSYFENVIISNSECSALLGPIEDTAMCLSGEDGRSVCYGDSGGPLVVNGVQVGVCAFVAARCAPGYPSGYTRLTSFLDWIQENS